VSKFHLMNKRTKRLKTDGQTQRTCVRQIR